MYQQARLDFNMRLLADLRERSDHRERPEAGVEAELHTWGMEESEEPDWPPLTTQHDTMYLSYLMCSPARTFRRLFLSEKYLKASVLPTDIKGEKTVSKIKVLLFLP